MLTNGLYILISFFALLTLAKKPPSNSGTLGHLERSEGIRAQEQTACFQSETIVGSPYHVFQRHRPGCNFPEISFFDIGALVRFNAFFRWGDPFVLCRR